MFEEQGWSIMWCGLAAVALLGVGALILRSLGGKLEDGVRSTLDAEAERLAANWLAEQLACSREQALDSLRSDDAQSAGAHRWLEAGAKLERSFERSAKGRYIMTSRLTDQRGARLEQSRAITLDELPDTVRAAIVRGQSPIIVPWAPAFIKER